MNQPSTTLWLRVNGIQPAYAVEYGVQSARADELRAADPYRQANASYSLVQWNGRELARHTLIDAGMGVVPSLLEFEHLHGVHLLHELVFSHSHFDHIAGLDWLANSVGRNGRPGQPRPLPVHATPECWATGPQHHFSYLADRYVMHQPLTPGRTVELGDVRLLPFSVEHKASAPNAVGFVVQHGGRKIVLTCDFYRVPSEDDAVFRGADVCFMDATDWHPRTKRKGHCSVVEGLELLRKWRPWRTYLIHYSGLDDREHANHPINGPLALDRLQTELDRVRGDLDVRVARHGMILGKDVDWPQ